MSIIVRLRWRGFAFRSCVFDKSGLAAAGYPLDIAINSALPPVFIRSDAEVD